MGASVGTDSKGSVNVELNVVPFIDLMSCLTAFLLVTAVWTRYSAIDIEPTQQGKAKEKQETPKEKFPRVSVLIQPDQIMATVGTPGGMATWTNLPLDANSATGLSASVGSKLEKLFTELKEDSGLQAPGNPYKETVEVAADESEGPDKNKVLYQHIIDVMDLARKAGFKRLQLRSPGQLSNKVFR